MSTKNEEQKVKPDTIQQKPKKKVSKKKRKAIAAKAIELLKQQFPKTFMDGDDIKPLKVGIQEDIVAMLKLMPKRPITCYACRLAVIHYANQIEYKKALFQPDAYRINLKGEQAEKVTDAHAEHANERYAQMLEQQKAKEKQQQRCQRSSA